MRFAGSNPQIASYMQSSPRFDEMGVMQGNARTLERKTGHEAEGLVASSGLDAMGKVKAAGHEARGIVAQGAAAGSAARAQGMSSMFSGIAGGIGNMSFRWWWRRLCSCNYSNWLWCRFNSRRWVYTFYIC